MATLAVRSLRPRDLPALRHVRQQVARLDLPSPASPAAPESARIALAALHELAQRRRVFVALVDGELCGYLDIVPDPRRVVWDVRSVAAGSPRLDASDNVCEELWEALLEHAIVRAGEARVRRVFAAAHEDSIAHQSLRAAGFEAYTRLAVLTGHGPRQPVSLPAGMRRQERSDVWAIHQLYQRITPRVAQFAEARTGSAWELPPLGLRARAPLPLPTALRDPQPCAFVLETAHGIHGYCRIARRRVGHVVDVMVDVGLDGAADFVLAAAAQAAVDPADTLCLILPAYVGERVSEFCAAGFELQDERLAMIRHTTVPAPAAVRLAPLSAMESAERVAPRGVPSYS